MYQSKLVSFKFTEHLPISTFFRSCGQASKRLQSRKFHLHGSILCFGSCSVDLSEVISSHRSQLGAVPDCVSSATLRDQSADYRAQGYGLRLRQRGHRSLTVGISFGTVLTAKAAVHLQTRPYLRGSIPTLIHTTDGKTHTVNTLEN
jgi:hypothetical protein